MNHIIVHQYYILGFLCTKLSSSKGLLSDKEIAGGTSLGLCDVGTDLELLESLGYIKLMYWNVRGGKDDPQEQIGYEPTQKGWKYWCKEEVVF